MKEHKNRFTSKFYILRIFRSKHETDFIQSVSCFIVVYYINVEMIMITSITTIYKIMPRLSRIGLFEVS